eukprot:4531088-Prymnesium_polylepis.1
MAPSPATAVAVTLMGAIALKLAAGPTTGRRKMSRPGEADGNFSGETHSPRMATASRTRPRTEVRAEGARGRHGAAVAEVRGLRQ